MVSSFTATANTQTVSADELKIQDVNIEVVAAASWYLVAGSGYVIVCK